MRSPSPNVKHHQKHHSSSSTSSSISLSNLPMCKTTKEAIDVLIAIGTAKQQKSLDNNVFEKIKVLTDSILSPDNAAMQELSTHSPTGQNDVCAFLKSIISSLQSQSSSSSSSSSASTTTITSSDQASELLTLVSNPNVIKGMIKLFTLTETGLEWNSATKSLLKLVSFLEVESELRQVFIAEWIDACKSRCQAFFDEMFVVSSFSSSSSVIDPLQDKKGVKWIKLIEYFAHYYNVQNKSFCGTAWSNHTSSTINEKQQTFETEEEALDFIKNRQKVFSSLAHHANDLAVFCKQMIESMTLSVASLQEQITDTQQELDTLLMQEQDENGSEDAAAGSSLTTKNLISKHQETLSQLQDRLKLQRTLTKEFISKIRTRVDMTLTNLGSVQGTVLISSPAKTQQQQQQQQRDGLQGTTVSLPIIPTDLRLKVCRDFLFGGVDCSSSSSSSSLLGIKLKSVLLFLRDTPLAVCSLSREILEHSTLFSASSSSSSPENEGQQQLQVKKEPGESPSHDQEDSADAAAATVKSHPNKNPLLALFEVLLDLIRTGGSDVFSSSDDKNNKSNNDSLSSSSQFLLDSFVLSAHQTRDHQISFDDENDGDAKNNANESNRAEQQDTLVFQDLLQDSGVFSIWLHVAAKCLGLILTTAPSTIDEENDDSRCDESKWRSFDSEEYEKQYGNGKLVFHYQKQEEKQQQQQEQDEKTSEDAASRVTSRISSSSSTHDKEKQQLVLSSSTSVNVLFSDEDWDSLGTLLIDGVCDSFLMKNNKISDKHSNGNLQATNGISSLWIAAARFCSFRPIAGVNTINKYHDRSEIFASWLFALGQRVITIIQDAEFPSPSQKQQQNPKSPSPSPSLVATMALDNYSSFFSQLTSHVIEIFLSCAELQPTLVSGVVQGLWEEYQDHMLKTCCSSLSVSSSSSKNNNNNTNNIKNGDNNALSLSLLLLSSFKSKLISEFICSIISDRFFDAEIPGNENSAREFEVMIEGLCSDINTRRRLPTTLLTIEFFINIAGKSFASFGSPCVLARKILDLGYGLILQHYNNNNNNNNTKNQQKLRLDLMDGTVQQLIKNEEENDSTLLSSPSSDKQSRKIQRVIMLYSSLIRICTKILIASCSTLSSRTSSTSSVQEKYNRGKVEGMLMDMLDFGHKKFFLRNELGNTSNHFNPFLLVNTPDHAREFIFTQMTNTALDILNFLCAPQFFPNASSSSTSSSTSQNKDFSYSTFHMVGITTVFNICNLLAYGTDENNGGGAENDGNSSSSSSANAYLVTISHLVMKYFEVCSDGFSHVEDHPQTAFFIERIGEIESIRAKKPLCLVVLAQCGVLLAQNHFGDEKKKQKDKSNNNSVDTPVQEDSSSEAVRSMIHVLAEKTKSLQETLTTTTTTSSSSSSSTLSTRDKEKLQEVMKTVAQLMNL